MNAKNMLKLLEKCATDARACFPNSASGRSGYFLQALANEFDLVEEPLAPLLRALPCPLTDADYATSVAAGVAP
jgi:hypothetical protein